MLKEEKNIALTKSDKRNSIVILEKTVYENLRTIY